ncbi:MAG: hypothetical protein P9M00_07705 [Candidatus Tritonobacter lacicola]|nr:hypothetical protein [Candidatus Tritonobacter lacicola]
MKYLFPVINDMKSAILTIAAALLLVSPSRTARANTIVEVENIVIMTESEDDAALAKKVANLAIAHGLSGSFKSIFVNANKGDKFFPPIIIIKLSEKGQSVPSREREKLDRLLDEVTFLMARHFKDRTIEVWIQNSEHENLMKAVYDPGDRKVVKKALGTASNAGEPPGAEAELPPPENTAVAPEKNRGEEVE